MSTALIDIRPARIQDAAAITAVHDSAWRQAYRGIIPGRELERMVERRGSTWWSSAIQRGSRVLLLSMADEVAGYASYGRNRAQALGVGGEIYELYVKPEYQGVGLGRRLFTAAQAELDQRGLAGMAVWALADNELACTFYRALGGRPSARGTETFAGQELDKLAFVWP